MELVLVVHNSQNIALSEIVADLEVEVENVVIHRERKLKDCEGNDEQNNLDQCRQDVLDRSWKDTQGEDYVNAIVGNIQHTNSV